MTLPLKQHFHIPDGMIYLDGNSLGPLPKTAMARAKTTLEEEWGEGLIRSWNKAGWMDMPRVVGNQIASLIGAPEGSVATGDTLSIKVYQALDAALSLRPERRVILSDTGNFPTDLYMAQGLVQTLDKGHQIKTVAPEDVMAAITDEVAVVMLTHVDYRTGRMHDMHAITKAAHAAGAVMIWDLAHSAGAMAIEMGASHAEFAIGCTYKYFNGGPGAPAFIYVRPDLIADLRPALSGWLGHEDPFAMAPEYQPAEGTERMRVGTPSILQLSVLQDALSLWTAVDLTELRAASIHLSDLFISEVEKRCPMLTLASPRNPKERGSHVSFHFEHGYAAVQALIAENVIGDFRQPDIMRFGITPLYLDEDDILTACDRLEKVMTQELWRNPAFAVKSRVT